MKKIIIDYRMRKIEKDFLIGLGYELIELEKSKDVYEEISAHPDIFCAKIGNALVVEPRSYDYLKSALSSDVTIYKGEGKLGEKYPQDIKYNICIVGNYAIHNFKYTDVAMLKLIEVKGYEKIDVSQGYANCSIAVIDDNSVITSDKGIYNKLNGTGIEVLLIEPDDIKLLSTSPKGKDGYSIKRGFIGGCITRLGQNVFISGDLNKLKSAEEIRIFIKKRNLNVIDFSGYDVVDYGGMVEI